MNYKNIWINQLLKAGRKPEVRILGESTHSDCEEQYIKSYKAKGAILLNMTDNGKDFGRGGGHTITRQDIEKIRKSLGLYFTPSLFPEEY